MAEMRKVFVTLTVFSAVLLIFLAWRVYCWIWLKPRRMEKYLREKGVVGPSYTFLHGNLKEIARLTKEAQSRPMELSHRIVPRVLPFYDQVVQNCGKMFMTWYGPTLKLNIVDPELIREIFLNKSDFFVKTWSNALTKLLICGVVTYEGAKWARHRRIMNPAFHPEKLKMMSPAFYTSCSNLIGKWQELATAGSCELDVWPDLQNLTRDVISRTAFGSSYEEGRQIFQLTDELAEHVFYFSMSANIPGFRFLQTKRSNRMKKIAKNIRELLRGIINKRLEAMKIGLVPNDLLGLLLESNSEEIECDGNGKNVGMSIDDIIDECKLFYFAGQETTSTLLVWVMIVLSMHQDWQEKAREEVMQIFGRRKPDFDGLNRLKVVTMILHEVLRLYPPVAFITRAIDRDISLGDVCLRRGAQITLQTLLLHHSHDIWGKDADEFRPERFSGGVGEATKNQMAFFPFGWGARMCLGQGFVFIEVKMALSMILQSFSFELSPAYVHAPYSTIALKPQHGAHLMLQTL